MEDASETEGLERPRVFMAGGPPPPSDVTRLYAGTKYLLRQDDGMWESTGGTRSDWATIGGSLTQSILVDASRDFTADRADGLRMKPPGAADMPTGGFPPPIQRWPRSRG
jgi:hypothetical protein